jgi:RNA polymerase sigma factor (sigma-70 family)
MTSIMAPAALLDGRERFLAFIRSKVSDPELAEDILQDSLLKALRSGPALRDQDRLLPWFYAILRNAIIDAYRRQGREPARVELAFAEEVAERTEDEGTVCECFRAVLPALKPEYAQLIEEFDLKGSSAARMIEITGATPNGLKVRHHRARQALRRRLEETCRVCAEHHCLDCTCEAARPRV